MNRVRHNKTSLFLMELIIAVLFFAISGAICVKLFVSAHILSDKSVDVNNAVLWTQNIAEVFQGKRGNLHEIADYYADNSMVLVSFEENPEIGTMVMLFDEDWCPVYYPTSDVANDEAKFELLLCVSLLPAKEVYSDTESDYESISGNSLVGEIMILRLGDNSIVDEIPKGINENIISDRYVDYYVGSEEAPNEP